METMKPEQTKKQPQQANENEVPVEALFFAGIRSLPFDGCGGGVLKMHATQSRAITFLRRERQFKIIETYGDAKRKTMVLVMDSGGVAYQPVL